MVIKGNRSIVYDLIVNAGGIALASWLLDGFIIDSGWSFLGLVLLMGFLNAFLKPLLVLFTLPFVVLTFGLGLWVINSLIFYLAGNLIPGVVVMSFGNAMLAALVVSLAGMLLNLFFLRGSPRVRVTSTRSTHSENRSIPHRKKRDDDVIDV